MQDTAQVKKVRYVVAKTWEGDIYILSGFASPQEADTFAEKAGKVVLPNGDVRKYADFKAFLWKESYEFQAEAKDRHKRGQFIRGDKWYDAQGEVCNARLERITGAMKALPMAKESTPPGLPG